MSMRLSTRRLRPDEHIIRLVPALSVLAAILVMAAPVPLAWGVLPQLPLLFVLIWERLAPRLMPPVAVLLLGVLTDLVCATPLGVHALLLPAAAITMRVTEARTETRSLVIDWLFAALIVVITNLLGWQMLAFTDRAAPLLPILAQAGITIIAWPLVVGIAARIQRQILER